MPIARSSLTECWVAFVFNSWAACMNRSEEHTSELQSQSNLVCRLLLETKNVAPPLFFVQPHRIRLGCCRGSRLLCFKYSIHFDPGRVHRPARDHALSPSPEHLEPLPAT